MTIWFDMDGTIADLYAVENWLPKLRAYDASPYADAAPLLRLCDLARTLHKLQRAGYTIGIISWLSKDPDPAYGEAVIAAKQVWLHQHLPSVRWDYIEISSYGTPKSIIAHIQPDDLLFDDEMQNIEEWEKAGGVGYFPENIMEILRSL